ncbi:MAG: helix-turn-helix domain-containing protein [Actinomycetota bacterium]|nr:helix-turn-helix domain-containing protein [Actinomycetota bacterium]MEE2958955.1 helix-turn-helix domain-containing protein [Actinomycetota bacterium]
MARSAAAPVSASSSPSADAVLAAVATVVETFGGTMVAADSMSVGDVPVVLYDEVLAGVRPPAPLPDTHLDLHDALPTLIAEVEAELGLPCAEMDRAQKQEVVFLLNERGAFTLRKSVEDVAEAIGVSRFTVYNYLERAEAT